MSYATQINASLGNVFILRFWTAKSLPKCYKIRDSTKKTIHH